MIKQTILFDLDDTLIHCNKYFDIVVDQFADQMEMWFHTYHIPVEEIKKKQSQIDLDRVLQSGFAPDHFPESFVETYDYFSDLTGRIKDTDEIERLMELGRGVYGHSIEPYPFMLETLNELQADGHVLHLYTGGDPIIQMRKVTEAGLLPFFAGRIHVARHKTVDFLEALIMEQALDRKSTWMIGNSLRTDVTPALKTGIHSIFMPAIQEWSFNNVEVDAEPQGAYLTLTTLKDIPDAIRRYFSGATV
ncbi:HAD family hydrolase [Paenibacillus radicis (ex Xue et al. 2023)]|uniref:HAD family hydrolase n=1 Tax=Paenibacillus radicis (ex Xue et al. 2023) TaxID=2972489 RepID=A0ABT1YU26_9BACL|nr:HAD family hydrolase [Paenibacillus radicis (ex Xue et al. 2023)]MCR8636701.1 HAD family hydrolase [Paenibacillus radicis (ex Xue et al. 2023)]